METEITIDNREKIEAMQAEMMEGERVEVPCEHRFTPGMYIREVTIPAGTLIVSMAHKTEHPFVISKGRILVAADHEAAVELTAPHTGITMPGTRRILHALEETVWTTFHVTNETDVEKIVMEITEPNENPQLNQWRESLPCHS